MEVPIIDILGSKLRATDYEKIFCVAFFSRFCEVERADDNDVTIDDHDFVSFLFLRAAAVVDDGCQLPRTRKRKLSKAVAIMGT